MLSSNEEVGDRLDNSVTWKSSENLWIRHISGEYTFVADALSQPSSVTTPYASFLEQDAAIQEILNSGSTLWLEWLYISGTDVHTTSSAIRNTFRRQVWQPPWLWPTGSYVNVKLASQMFVWPGVGNECQVWTRACTPCQCSKVTYTWRPPSGASNLPRTFFSVHIDLVRPVHVRLYAGTVSWSSTDTRVGLRHSLFLR